MTRLLFRGATLSSGERTDILVSEGRILELGTGLNDAKAELVDTNGLLALTGLVDLHTHLREPGFEQSETVLSGSRAAAAGGYTVIHAMANTSPVADTAGVVEQVHSLGVEAGLVEVRPVGAVTAGLAGEALAEIGAMARSRAKVRVFSDDGRCVFNSQLMRRALEYVKSFDGVIAQHAQDPNLTEGAQMNEGALNSELGLAGWPAAAEEAIIARDVLLAGETGARLHVCHVSTAGSVDLLRWAKARGILVTAEATPHHLLLTEETARGYDSRFKVNPPLRTSEDVAALREGLRDGTIDAIATDHAPHPLESKETEWQAAAFGMVGLESALSVVHAAMVETGEFGWTQLEAVMSTQPAGIGRVEGHPLRIAAGEPAEIVFYDPEARSEFEASRLRGKSSNSPFLGMTLPGKVVATVHRGRLTVKDGEVVEPSDSKAENGMVTNG